MNDVFSRAEALKLLIDKGTYGSSSQPIAEALVTCCSDLVEAGEPGRAISLLEASRGLPPSADATWALRLQIIHARALTVSGQFIESLNLLRRLAADFQDLLSFQSSESILIRISVATNLWSLNRADEAVERLLVVRSELLKLPDSYLLGWCVYQLASAETIRGNLASARRFALEAIVSARRCENRHLEASALQTYSLLERSPCRWASAVEAEEEALRISRESGNRRLESHALRGLAILEWKRGRLIKALQLTEECLERSTQLKNGRLNWFGTLLKGMILLHVGDHGTARSLFESGTTWDVPEAQTRPSLLTTEFLGDIHLEQGQAGDALRYYDEVWPKALALVPKGDIVAELRRRRAEAYYLLGRFEEAYAEAKTGLEHCRELGDRYEEAATYRVPAPTAVTAA
jgi:tetratricopeptide (TPR) repeat protein